MINCYKMYNFFLSEMVGKKLYYYYSVFVYDLLDIFYSTATPK